MENNEQKKSTDIENEINLKELFQALIDGKWIIGTIVLIASVLVVIYSLSLPNIYQSRALLSPADAENGMSNSLGGMSSLASLAGVNLTTQSGQSNPVKAIEKLNTLSFFEENILPHIFLPDLMAVKSWNLVNNTIEFDKNIFDESAGKWTREFTFPQKQTPSAQESFTKFQGDHLRISEDKQTGFISLVIKHQSPYIAKEWTELIVEQINTFFREKDKAEAESAVNYLNQQIANTRYTEIKQVMAELQQQQIQKLTLIEASDFYVFEYIDPPAVMEKKSEPSRAMICIFGALLGGMLGTLIVIVRHFRSKSTI
tara:strand:+ start:1196 stop:2137 length:942 start_codon:yes stop_codon:yes gene_type:complete